MPEYYPCSNYVQVSDPNEANKQSVYDMEIPGLLSFKAIHRVWGNANGQSRADVTPRVDAALGAAPATV